MTNSNTPTNRIEVVDRSGYHWQMAFPFRGTDKNLETFVRHFNASVVDGVNAHLSESSIIVSARVVAQKGPRKGQVLAEMACIN